MAGRPLALLFLVLVACCRSSRVLRLRSPALDFSSCEGLYSPLVPICSLVEIPLPVPLLVVTSSVEDPVDCANVAIEGGYRVFCRTTMWTFDSLVLLLHFYITVPNSSRENARRTCFN